MSDWTHDIAAAEAAAERHQAAEQLAERRFDLVHADAKAAGAQETAVQSQEFNEWMAARHATDAAWGAWSQVMDAKPQD
ncbi:MAG: hypothetical protein ABIR26_19550 [Ramlibacter sp.]